MSLITQHLDLPGVSAQVVGPKRVVLTAGCGTLVLRDDRVLLQLEGTRLRLTTTRRNRRHLAGLTGTWDSAIRRLARDQPRHCRLSARFKHFPISFRVQSGRVVVYNYLGGKDPAGGPAPLYVDISPRVQVTLVDPRTLSLTSYDHVALGNTVERFAALRYKTHLKNLDRRKFWDGFVAQYE